MIRYVHDSLIRRDRSRLLECSDLCQLGDGRSHEACDRICSCTEPTGIDY